MSPSDPTAGGALPPPAEVPLVPPPGAAATPADPLTATPTDGSLLGDLAPALRRALDETPVAAAELAGAVGRSLVEGRLPLVWPARDLADQLGFLRAAPDDPVRRQAWLLGELERAYGGRSRAAWTALVATGAVEVVALDEPGIDPVPVPEVGVPIRRVALPDGLTAVHPRTRWPAAVRVIGGVLVAVATAVLLWSYEVATVAWLPIAAVLGVVYASVEAAPVTALGRRVGVATWPVWRRQAALGAAVFGVVALAVGLLSIEGLRTGDATAVVVTLVVAGVWVGGGDLLAALALHQRGRRRVADLVSTRVLATR